MSGSVPNTPPGISLTEPYTEWTPAEWIAGWQSKADAALAGPTSSRPQLPISGYVIMYFDTTLGIPIWGTHTGWVSVGGVSV
jgi:hypothetical protein